MKQLEIPNWTKDATKTFSALTFDCYGTLIDWVNGILSAIQPILVKHGVRLSDPELLKVYARLEPTIQRSKGYRLYKQVLADVMEKLAFHFKVQFTEDECIGCFNKTLEAVS